MVWSGVVVEPYGNVRNQCITFRMNLRIFTGTVSHIANHS
jgi:hypothetical protein